MPVAAAVMLPFRVWGGFMDSVPRDLVTRDRAVLTVMPSPEIVPLLMILLLLMIVPSLAISPLLVSVTASPMARIWPSSISSVLFAGISASAARVTGLP